MLTMTYGGRLTMYTNWISPPSTTYQHPSASSPSSTTYQHPSTSSPSSTTYQPPSTSSPSSTTYQHPSTYSPSSTTYQPPSTSSPSSTTYQPPSSSSPSSTTYQHPSTSSPSSTTYQPPSTSSPFSTTYQPPSTSSPSSTTYQPPSTSSPSSTTYQPPSTSSPSSTTYPYPTNSLLTTTTYTHPTTSSPTFTTSYPYTTSSPSASALTVCLRYMSDQQNSFTLFSLTQGSNWNLILDRNYGVDRLSLYQTVQSFYSYTPLLPVNGIRPWTSLCVTWEMMTGVAQVWRGGSVSIRKRVTGQVISGPPVLSMYSFEGQVTDIEVWDHVLSPRLIMDYMSGYVYRSSGNLLTWSNAIYSTPSNVFLERNAYIFDNHPIRVRHSPPGPMKGKTKCKWRKREMAKQRKLKLRNSEKAEWLKTKREK